MVLAGSLFGDVTAGGCISPEGVPGLECWWWSERGGVCVDRAVVLASGRRGNLLCRQRKGMGFR